MEVEALAHWVLKKKFKIVNTDEYISEAYICYINCIAKYKPEFSNFATYFRTCLNGHMKDYFNYNERLIHIPKLKREYTEHSYISTETPILDSNTGEAVPTVGDMLESDIEDINAEEKEMAKWLSYLDDIYDNLTTMERKCVPYFKKFMLTGNVVPRNLSNAGSGIRTKLIAYKKKIEK